MFASNSIIIFKFYFFKSLNNIKRESQQLLSLSHFSRNPADVLPGDGVNPLGCHGDGGKPGMWSTGCER